MQQLVIVGVPTALGGHLGGMERTPGRLRAAGLPDRLTEALGAPVIDAGDVPIDPGFVPDPHPTAKNADRIAAFLPVEAAHVARTGAGAGGGAANGAPRLLVLGGDCTAHAGALAGLRRANPVARLAVAWFDAHGDLNTPDTTPSGNVWGMPFAMLLGRGRPDLVAACDGPTVALEDAALIGGQVLDEPESRWLAASPVAHFGAGMVRTPAGLAALEAWAGVVAARTDGVYVAVDMDCLDPSTGVGVQMPEPGGLALESLLEALGVLDRTIGVVALGATGVNLGDRDAEPTVEAITALAVAALGGGGRRA